MKSGRWLRRTGLLVSSFALLAQGCQPSAGGFPGPSLPGLATVPGVITSAPVPLGGDLSAVLAPPMTGTGTGTGTVTGPLTSRIDAIIQEQIGPESPGAVVVVVQDRRVTHMKGYGLARIGTREPWTPDTVHNLASVSKAFTAFAALILMERGQLSLEDLVESSIPELAGISPDRPIKVRDLVYMTSGFPDSTWLFDGYESVTNDELAATIAGYPLERTPGSAHEYCNTDYAFLALVVERVSGVPFPEFVSREIFQPLGMTSTRVWNDRNSRLPNQAEPTFKNPETGQREVRYDDFRTYGPCQVYSSGRDLALWALELDRPTRVRPESLALAFRSGRTDDGQEVGYGFGWGCDGAPGDRVISHTGGWTGISSEILARPDQHTTVILVSNDQDFDPVTPGGKIDALIATPGGPARAPQPRESRLRRPRS